MAILVDTNIKMSTFPTIPNMITIQSSKLKILRTPKNCLHIQCAKQKKNLDQC